MSLLDQANDIRKGEELDISNLADYLVEQSDEFVGAITLKQFTKGFSNLTYLLSVGNKDYVLRRPPFGANIKTAHDMSREFKLLTLLQPYYGKIPQPVLYCEDTEVIGAPFYIMERIEGVVIRSKIPEGMDASPDFMRQLSISLIDNLAEIHSIDIYESKLTDLGKPEGYVARQVSGWIKRYQNAATDVIVEMDELAAWMTQHQPADNPPALIHNDYKYDNVVLDPENLTQIKAVLDWEMATIGDPLMDLGTTLAYWVAAEENDLLKSFNLSWLPGNLTRKELVERYLSKSSLKVQPSDLLFYYIFGIFKVAVIAQQIYSRFKAGHSQDKRFAGMIHLVRAAAGNGIMALERGGI